jgi:hypothetical protein
MYTFTALRISSNDNVLFPDVIRIDAYNVYYSKGTLVGYRTTTIPRYAIAAISLDSGLLFADIIIHSSGNKAIVAHGFSKKDAKQILELLD